MENVKTVPTDIEHTPPMDEVMPSIALVGNPNVGKSVIFGILTGRYVNVSNYPGTTVEITRGFGKLQKQTISFIDTPGTNSFIPGSEDERVTRDILLQEKITSVLQIADAKNLKRALLLSLQLSEMNIPFVINLNMMDELDSRGLHIDIEELTRIVGVPVNETTAIRRKGTERIPQVVENAKQGKLNFKYPDAVESAISNVESLLPLDTPVAQRAMAIMLLVQDDSLRKWVKTNLDDNKIERLQEIIWNLEAKLKESIVSTINEYRYRFISQIYDQVVSDSGVMKGNLVKKLDVLITHPIWGVPILLITLYVVYQFVGVFGAGFMVDFFENVIFGKAINPAAVWLFRLSFAGQNTPGIICRSLWDYHHGVILRLCDRFTHRVSLFPCFQYAGGFWISAANCPDG